jgi:5'-3' exonuclease
MLELLDKRAKLGILKRIKNIAREESLSKMKKPKMDENEEESASDLEKESAEHPSFSMEQIRKIVRDHMKKGDNTEKEDDEDDDNNNGGNASGIHIHIHTPPHPSPSSSG